MVFIFPFIGAVATLSGFVSGLPRPGPQMADSSAGGYGGADAAYGAPPMANVAPPMADTAPPMADAAPPMAYGASADQAMTTTVTTQSTTTAYYTATNAAYNAGSGSNYYGGNNQYQYGSAESSTITAAPMTSTWTSSSAYSTPAYGSGSSNWGNNQMYNDCVQQCVASYSGLPPAAYTASATNTPAYGTGATHTVIVAPTQGVLRYIPFAVNASVGDTIKFMWGANNHTVTKSSALLPCNKSSDALFTSGTQNKGFVFTQVVNDTNPTFFYCGTPTHCQKGMFGIINPPSALTSGTSVASMMPGLIANNSDVAAYAAYTANQTVLAPQTSSWGNSIDMSSMPDWSHEYVATNVMYTRQFLAANPEALKDDGSIDLSNSETTPLMIPQDLTPALLDASSPSSASATPAAPPAAASPATSSSPTSAPQNQPNGAVTLSSSSALTALSALVIGFMMI